MIFKRAIILISFFLFYQFALVRGQIVAVKTNVLSDVLKVPSLGAEVGLSPKISFDFTAYYNPWKQHENEQYKLFIMQPELKYWLNGKFNGHFVGLNGMSGVYNIMGIDPLLHLWKSNSNYRYKGYIYGGGISYGYDFVISRHWNVEASIGAGYAFLKYRKYVCATCGKELKNSSKGYFGPTKAAINLVYLF